MLYTYVLQTKDGLQSRPLQFNLNDGPPVEYIDRPIVAPVPYADMDTKPVATLDRYRRYILHSRTAAGMLIYEEV